MRRFITSYKHIFNTSKKPELAAKRMRAIYEQKGYSEEWIEKRLRGIAVRDELTLTPRLRREHEMRTIQALLKAAQNGHRSLDTPRRHSYCAAQP